MAEDIPAQETRRVEVDHSLRVGVGLEPGEAVTVRAAHLPRTRSRWKDTLFGHARTLGGADGDPVVRAVAALGMLADRIAAVESAITRVTAPRA
ncbi:hypothetical protein [Streptomyces sp. NPDC055400]